MKLNASQRECFPAVKTAPKSLRSLLATAVSAKLRKEKRPGLSTATQTLQTSLAAAGASFMHSRG